MVEKAFQSAWELQKCTTQSAFVGMKGYTQAELRVFLFSRDGQITAILDQKNYVEELNRHLR